LNYRTWYVGHFGHHLDLLDEEVGGRASEPDT
jgi:hypothetical protein